MFSKRGFKNWLDKQFSKTFPEEAIALNFNIYECPDLIWAVEVIGADEFDVDDEDWACSEVFDTRDDEFQFKSRQTWEKIQAKVHKQVVRYFNKNPHLKKYMGIGVGFVDGDLLLVHVSEDYENYAANREEKEFIGPGECLVLDLNQKQTEE